MNFFDEIGTAGGTGQHGPAAAVDLNFRKMMQENDLGNPFLRADVDAVYFRGSLQSIPGIILRNRLNPFERQPFGRYTTGTFLSRRQQVYVFFPAEQ